MIAIIDYGMGNIHSVQKALEHLGAKTLVTNKPADLKECAKIVVPGVGAFDDAIEELKKRDLVSAIKDSALNKKIFLGICLGMQILFEASEEALREKGLGILKGRVKRFESKTGIKVPHMGWNELKIKQKNCPLLQDLKDNSFVYFCHSYYPVPQEEAVTAATADYGVEFASLVWQANVYGVQFHPEKSQKAGMRILKNFVELK